MGIVQLTADRSLVMADIPGLIEGAHLGAGLGHEFLKHIQRSGILVHLVEPEPADGSRPLDNYRVVRSELEQYDESLAQRPEIVALSKCELPGAAEAQQALAAALGREVLAISAVTGQGLDRLVRELVRALDERSGQPHAARA
jgi:GTP-binding protein